MKRLFWILGALVIAAAIGISMHRHPGVIIVAFSPWRVDIPLWVGALLFVLLYLSLHLIVQVLSAIWRAARSLAHLGRHYRKHRAKALARKGFMALAQGNFSVAEKALEQSAQESELPWYNYFCAAKAAYALGEDARAAQYMTRAKILAPDSALAIALEQAQHCLKTKKYDQAIAILFPLNEKLPNEPKILEGLYAGYYGLQNWERLSWLLPKLKKNKVLSKSNYQALEIEVWKKRLTINKKASLVDLQTVWKEIPAPLHTDKTLALLYAKCLIRNKQFVEAESILRNAIKHEWNEALVRCYGELSHPQSQKLLNTAESWLHTHEMSPALLLTLGRLSVQQELWGKAQRYYEASLSLEGSPETYAELATLLEKMNKPELSAKYFKKGLLLAAPVMESVPPIALDRQ